MSRVIRTRPAAAPPKRTKEVAKGYITSKASDRVGPYHEDREDFDIFTQEFTEDNPPAYVKAGAGLTINMGQFESLRLDCSVSLPVDRTRLDEGFDEATEIVFRRLSDEQTRWLGESSHRVGGKV